MKCNRNRLHCQFNRNRRLIWRSNWEIFTLPTSLYGEPRLWWLGFLLYHRLSWLRFRRGYLPVCVG